MYIYPTLAATALLFSSTYAFKAQCIGNAVNGDNLAAAKQNLIDWCKAGNTVGTWRWFAVNDVMAYVCNSVVHGDDPGCKEEDINSAFSAITSSCGYGIAGDPYGMARVTYGFAPAGLQACPHWDAP